MANQIKRHCKLITDQYEMQLGQFLDCIKARAPWRKVSEKSSEKVQRGWGAGAKKSGGLRRHRRIFPLLALVPFHKSTFVSLRPRPTVLLANLISFFNCSTRYENTISYHLQFMRSWNGSSGICCFTLPIGKSPLNIGSWIFTQNLTLHLSDSSDPGHWSAPTHCQQETFKLWTGFAQIFRCEPLWNRNISSVQKQQDFETNLSDF